MMKDTKTEKNKLRRYLDDMYIREEASQLLESMRDADHKDILDELSAEVWEESISQHARQATGVAKAPYVCQFVRALLDGGEKVLLFAHHHQVMDIYKQELKAFSPGFITGRK